MYADSKSWVKACPKCQEVNTSPGQDKIGRLHSAWANYPGEVWTADMLLLPQMDLGNRYLLVGQDMFTKSWELKANKEESPENTVQFYYEQIFPKWEAARIFRTDRGHEFNNQIIREALRLYATLQILGAVEHPQFTGAVERGIEQYYLI